MTSIRGSPGLDRRFKDYEQTILDSDIDSSESEEGSVQLLIDGNERKALPGPINGVSIMPVSQLIQSASWFHRRSSHDGQSVAVFLSPGVSSRSGH